MQPFKITKEIRRLCWVLFQNYHSLGALLYVPKCRVEKHREFAVHIKLTFPFFPIKWECWTSVVANFDLLDSANVNPNHNSLTVSRLIPARLGYIIKEISMILSTWTVKIWSILSWKIHLGLMWLLCIRVNIDQEAIVLKHTDSLLLNCQRVGFNTIDTVNS